MLETNKIHMESQETYDFIGDWIDPNFFYSKKDVWHRFGMLGVFGDYVLSCTEGEILEIGVGESSIYLSHLARKWDRFIYHCDISEGKIVNPLTIDGYLIPKGISRKPEEGRTPEWFESKKSQFFIMPSDQMFNGDREIRPLALSFIDGDHIYTEVRKDFYNVMKKTVDNGYVILHDTYPPSDDYLREERCGSVYILRKEIEAHPNYDCITLPIGCAIGVGLTIVRKKPSGRAYYNG